MPIFCKVQNFFFREKKIIIVIKSISYSNNCYFQDKLLLLQKEFLKSVQYSLRNRVTNTNTNDDNDYTIDLVPS